MASFYIKQLSILFIVWVIYKQVRLWVSRRSLKKWGEQYGCADLPILPNKLPGGLERFKVLITGLKDIDLLEDLIRKPTITMKCHTYRVFGLFNSSTVATSDPENIQAMLATKFHDFDIGQNREGNFSHMLGDGIFTATIDRWPHFRGQLKPQFTRDQVSDLEAADRHLQVLFKALPDENGEGWVQSVDLKPMFYRFTLDASTEFLFGSSVNSQTNTIHSLESSLSASKQAADDQRFAEAMDFAQEYIARRFPLGNYYWLMNSKEFQQACKTVKEYAARFVTMALDPNHKPSTEKFVLLDALVAETRNPVELRDHVLQILLAGRDTTSSLVSWAILLLSRHPAEFQTLREAILSHFGTESEPTQELTFSSLKSCKPITHLLYETMRLYPLVPANSRQAIKDTVLPTGGGPDRKQPITVQKGELVSFAIYVMHRRPDIWGPDSEEFIPSRWEGRKLGWEYIPFSGGPRVCLGQQYALNEASLVIVKFLQRYDKIEALDLGPIKKGLALSLSPGDGVNVRMHRAAR